MKLAQLYSSDIQRGASSTPIREGPQTSLINHCGSSDEEGGRDSVGPKRSLNLIKEEGAIVDDGYKTPMRQYGQPRVVSDHCALVMKSWVKDCCSKPLKSIDAWHMEPGFKELEHPKLHCVLGVAAIRGKCVLSAMRCKESVLGSTERPCSA
ncbi:hypothetical protein VNO80_23243 [Phaseolus coccineus]|uniref:Uncharacterized protein n=1 Tax=Phaseolus coccineus TaxID=3886 RepID=A0AAN9QV17_PHACN